MDITEKMFGEKKNWETKSIHFFVYWHFILLDLHGNYDTARITQISQIWILWIYASEERNQNKKWAKAKVLPDSKMFFIYFQADLMS